MNGIPNEVIIVISCIIFCFIAYQGFKLSKKDGGNSSSGSGNSNTSNTDSKK